MKTKRTLSLLLGILMLISAFPYVFPINVSAAAEPPVVYWSMGGDDRNGGLHPGNAVKTLERAFEILAESEMGGTVVITDGINNNYSGSSIITLPDAGGPVTITSVHGSDDYRTKYPADPARLMLYYGYIFNNDVIFDSIDFLHVTKPTTNRSLYMQNHDLTITSTCNLYKYLGGTSIGTCPDKTGDAMTCDGKLVIVTGYKSATGDAQNFGSQTIDIQGSTLGTVYVGNKAYESANGSSVTITNQARQDIGNVWIRIGENVSLTNGILADGTEPNTKTFVDLHESQKNTTVTFDGGISTSERITLFTDTDFTDVGYSLKMHQDGPAVGLDEEINVEFVDRGISEFGVIFRLAEVSNEDVPFVNLGAYDKDGISIAYKKDLPEARHYYYAKDDEVASFKGSLVYDNGNEIMHLDTMISAFPYAIDEETGFMYLGTEKVFTLRERCQSIIDNMEASEEDKLIAQQILTSAELQAPEVVYVDATGGGNGLNATSCVTFKEALGMVKANGGTIVVCEPIVIDATDTVDQDKNDGATSNTNRKANGEDFTYYLPYVNARVTITAEHEGKEYGGALELVSDLGFYGDYTLENIDLINASSIDERRYLYLQYNDIILGEGIETVNEKNPENRLAIICGYSSTRPQWTTVDEISCKSDAKITVQSGTWEYLLGGNYRPNQYSIFGDIRTDAKLYIEITGGTFTGDTTSQDKSVTVTGMNSVSGQVYMQISGGTFNEGVHLISRAGSVHTTTTYTTDENGKQIIDVPQTLSTNDLPTLTGKITLKITGGTFKTSTIQTFQSSTSYKKFDEADITLCINGGSFAQNTTPTGTSSTNNDKLILPTDGYTNINQTTTFTTTKNSDMVKSITPPVLSSTKPEASVPEQNRKVEGDNNPHLLETEGLGEHTAANLSLVKQYYNIKYDHDSKYLDDEGYNLAGVNTVEFIGMLTGEYSINKTITNYGIGGAGGGYMIDCGDYVLFAFGDTKAEDGGNGAGDTEDSGFAYGGPWRANTLAFTTNKDYKDGILLDGFFMSDSGNQVNSTHANEFLISNHMPGEEQSKIPTGGIKIGDTLYMGYMSVRRWSDSDRKNADSEDKSGVWKCNYGGIAISRDNGKTWETPSDLRWPEESGFAQLYPVVEGEWVYIFGVPGGRKGACKLMRVKADEIENFAAYEYFVGYQDGVAKFRKGNGAMLSENYAIDACVGGVGVMYNEFLGEWIIVYASSNTGDYKSGGIYMRSAKSLDSEWSEPVLVLKQDKELFGTVYEPRICDVYQDKEKGEMLLICSNMTSHTVDGLSTTLYNSMVFNVTLIRHKEPIE